jgi:hypothetical protein
LWLRMDQKLLALLWVTSVRIVEPVGTVVHVLIFFDLEFDCILMDLHMPVGM